MTLLLKFCLVALACLGPASGWSVANIFSLTYTPASPENLLKGFFPYAGSYSTFPHSLEWNYLPLRSLMTGPTNFNWSPLENQKNEIAGRRHQAVFRIYLGYPTLTTGIP